MLTLSNVLPRRQPARMPIHRPMPIVSTVEMPTSSNVLGKAVEDLAADRLGRIEAATEVATQRVADVLDELIPLAAVETEALDDRRRVAPGSACSAPCTCASGSRSTTRNRKKLKTSTIASRTIASISFLTTKRTLTTLLAFVVASLAARTEPQAATGDRHDGRRDSDAHNPPCRCCRRTAALRRPARGRPATCW